MPQCERDIFRISSHYNTLSLSLSLSTHTPPKHGNGVGASLSIIGSDPCPLSMYICTHPQTLSKVTIEHSPQYSLSPCILQCNVPAD